MLSSRDFTSSSLISIKNINKYISNKDSYCILYLGGSTEYIFILNSLKEYFKEKFPEMSVFVCCKEAVINKLHEYDSNFIIPVEKTDLSTFGCVEEIKCDLNSTKHLLDDLCEILKVKLLFSIPNNLKVKTAKIYPNGILPIKSLNKNQIVFLENMMKQKNITLVEDDKLVDLAIGVDNYETYYHASKGLKTIIVNGEISKNLIKRLYENVEFLNIGHK